MDVLQDIATLPRGMGSRIPATHFCTYSGHWAVELLLKTATLPWGSCQWKQCDTLSHCLGAAGNGTPSARYGIAREHMAVELVPYNATPPTAVGGGIRATQCHNAPGKWAMDLLLHTATVHGGSGQWNSCYPPPHCRAAACSGNPTAQCLTASRQCTMESMWISASMPRGSSKLNS